MKVSSFCALFLMAVTAFAFFGFISATGPSLFPDLVNSRCGDKITPIAVSRKLKENVHGIKSSKKVDKGDQVTLEDYNPVDPSPDAAKNVNPGPIEHGTPFMPFIPKSPPPSQPTPGQDDYN
ncbi:hypothetical protein L195_g017420 [Trifolium pratense]|uniref:Uncharacterized protein n=2 Tax=Trifolium pratense TaxID=57577 RepID=A0ACB0M876_TRIPR|nr:uncharacterized protein LOC123916251 [Trifolium pratense]PNX94248.1 hypothetical protein L195_g017420 [Trifolium pratense]CAJ2677743.1 unnamed protein product [Trifolium pratense]